MRSSDEICSASRVLFREPDETQVQTFSPCMLYMVEGNDILSLGTSKTHTCQLLESWSRDTWDMMWFRLHVWSRSDHCEGKALAFLGGSGGMLPRKILKIETVKYAFFIVLVNDSTHLLQEKVGLKYIPFSCVQRKWQENELFNQSITLIYADFLLG